MPEQQNRTRTQESTPRPARRRVSMADVAAEAGVSQQTVSRVVNGHANVSEQTRERVQEAMEKLRFRPNFAGRSLRDGRYRAIGFCANDITEFGNLSMLDPIASIAREHGYAVTMIEMSKDESFSLDEASRRIAELPVDGMIISMSRMAPDFETFQPQPGMGTVIVSMYAHPRCTTVDSDQYGASLLVCDHLLAHGHTQIRFVAGPHISIDSQYREAGWRDTLAKHRIEPVEPLHGDWTARDGYEIGKRLVADPSATAIYVANDQMALGVIAALREAGKRVPQDVSVVGVDDSLGAYLPFNELTTVRFDLNERGRTAFRHAVPETGKDRVPVAIRIPGTLIERDTVADRR